jgi:hypothetical protein
MNGDPQTCVITGTSVQWLERVTDLNLCFNDRSAPVNTGFLQPVQYAARRHRQLMAVMPSYS